MSWYEVLLSTIPKWDSQLSI